MIEAPSRAICRPSALPASHAAPDWYEREGDEIVRVQCIVRPADISPNNTIDSSRVADARIVYAGRGSLADANTQGWLSRFFNSRFMPF